VDKPAETVFQEGGFEIKQQADTAIAQVEIGQKLTFVDRQDGIDRFDFDKNGVFDNEVGSVATIETNAFINSRQYNLSFKSQPGIRQFQRETILVKALKQSWADRFMNFNRHPNHLAGQLPRNQPNLFSAFSEHSASSGYHGP
jgi:hypothetical protein